MRRTETEGTVWATQRWTMYTSSRDKAIGIAEWLFGGRRLGATPFDSTLDEMVRKWSEVSAKTFTENRDTVIEYQGKIGGRAGHNYFRENPAVSSDLVLTVRYGRRPGAEHGRPLQHLGGIFWKIGDDYLASPDSNSILVSHRLCRCDPKRLCRSGVKE